MTPSVQWPSLVVLAASVVAAVLPLHSQQPVLAIRARTMVDVQRGRLIENATVLVGRRLCSLLS